MQAGPYTVAVILSRVHNRGLLILCLVSYVYTQSLTTELRYRSLVYYQSCTGLLWLMAVAFDTGDYRALVSAGRSYRRGLENYGVHCGQWPMQYSQL